MKKFFISLPALVIFHTALAQQNNTVIINPVKQNEEDLIKKMYQYPQFVKGGAFFKNGEIVESKLNYNYLTNQIVFINAKGDTLQLMHGDDFSKIVIETDTFYYYNKEFIQQLTHYPSYNLCIKHSLQNNGSERKGAYGTYSGTSSITSINTVVDNRISNVKLASDENLMYVFREAYFLSGRFGQFYPATKKGFYELFPKNQKQIKEFLEKNEINFSKKDDLEKLLEYARTFLKQSAEG